MRSMVVITTLLVAGLGLPWESSISGLRLPESAYLDEDSVAKAVRWGQTGFPQPYLLYPRHGKREPTVAVYTPVVRVALAVWVARQRGEDPAPGDLPAWVTAPTVHVVVRPPRHVAGLESDAPLGLRAVPITQIALSKPTRAIFLDYVRPIALLRDLSYLDAIGGKPFPDAVAAALFKPEEIVSGGDIYGWWQMGNTYYPVDGVLERRAISVWQ